jgi:glutathione synthase/RimK-type ligase-like ATP-grasp enzyme
MKRIALATYKGYPKGTESDQLLLEPFRNAGHEAVFVSWDNKRVDWHQFDTVIIRSCWDYHTRLNEFLDWITMLEDNHIPVWNPVPILKWNTQKTYLADLQKCGIETVPTVFVTKNNAIDLASLSWDEIVVKPSVGADAHDVSRFQRHNFVKAQQAIEKLQQTSDVLIQPLMKEIADGELSMVFIGGQFTHAVLKIPPRGEFRTNYANPTTETYHVPPDLLAQARNIYAKLDKQLLYARIDAVVVHNQLVLMELELVEPHLSFDLYPPSAERFVQSIHR